MKERAHVADENRKPSEAYNSSLVTHVPPTNLGALLRRIFLRAILVIVSGGVVVFGLDYTVFRVRVATNRNPYGSVTVSHYYAVLQKN